MISLRVFLDQYRFVLDSTEGTYPRPVVTLNSSISKVITYAIEDATSICTEKFGEAPTVLLNNNNKEIEMDFVFFSL